MQEVDFKHRLFSEMNFTMSFRPSLKRDLYEECERLKRLTLSPVEKETQRTESIRELCVELISDLQFKVHPPHEGRVPRGLRTFPDESAYRNGQYIKIDFTFTGDSRLFAILPSSSAPPPIGEVSDGSGYCIHVIDENEPEAQTQQKVKDIQDKISQYCRCWNKEIKEFNQEAQSAIYVALGG